MSVLGKYRKEAEREGEEAKSSAPERSATTQTTARIGTGGSVSNRDRRSPIVSFSMPSDLRACLQAIRKAKAINLSMWVEKHLREAVVAEFPSIAEKYLES